MVQKPNIVWISTHDINPHIGSYAGSWPGAEEAFTPHLDQLAAQGAQFEQAFSSAPVCGPSRSALFTGRYPTAIGTMHMRTKAVPPPEVKIFTEYLRASGYYTTNNYFTDFQFDYSPTHFDDCSDTAHWRNRDDPNQPFFAAFHSMVTHESQIYLEDEEFYQRTPHVTPDLRHDPATVTLPPYYPDTADFRKCWARYLDLITEMDQWVGDILADLEEDGLAQNTIVVFLSDHGVGMPRAKRWAHEAGLRVPLIIRWPGSIPAGTVRNEVTQLVDVAPTMLAAADVAVPSHFDGQIIFDREGNFMTPRDHAFGARDRMMEDVDIIRTVRDQRYRYIRNYRPDHPEMAYQHYPDQFVTWSEFRRLFYEESQQIGNGELPTRLTPLQRSVVAGSKAASEELYDLENDPHETRNLADSEEHASKLAELRTVLDDWVEGCQDQGLLPESELIGLWRPEGTKQMTEAPLVLEEDGKWSVSCSTPGASIGWVTEPPATDGLDAGSPGAKPALRGGQIDRAQKQRWNLYTEAIPKPKGKVWFRAFRLGYAPSPIVMT